MKQFLKKRWHHIPVGIVSALLAVCLIAGGAFAGWFTFVSGTAVVTVDEAMYVTSVTTANGTITGNQAAGYTWAVSLYPGETVTALAVVENLSSANLTLRGQIGYVPPGLTVHSHNTSLEDPFPVAGGAAQAFPIQITADGSVPNGTYTINFAFQRG